jgi:hypothetical protein
MAEQAFSGVSKLLALLDDDDGSVTREREGVLIVHHAVASLTEPQALGLGLPPSVRQALHIETKNLLIDADFGSLGPDHKGRYGLKRRPMQINGEIAGEKRQKIVDEFLSDTQSFDVMILSPRAGGVGLTLTSANHVIHLSRWWNPAVEDQCTDRVYRIGQNHTVYVYYPIAVHPHYGVGSFDVLLDRPLADKRELSKRMLLPPVNLKKDQKWFADNLGHESGAVMQVADIDEIDVMEPRAFQNWALRRCVPLGWSVSRTPASHDGGADGLLVHERTKARVIVQCKHKQRDDRACDAEAVDDLLRARSNFGSDIRLYALTNAPQFSRVAQERAERYGIALISRNELPHWPRHLL